MKLLSEIKNDNPQHIPEGIQALMKEKKIYIIGIDYAATAIKKLDEFNITINGVISSPKDCKETDISNIISYDEFEKYFDYGIIIGFSWFNNAEYLSELCNNPKINRLYILEGAEYAFVMKFFPKKGHFRHEKICFIDTSYRAILQRGLTYDYFIEHYNEFEQIYNMLEDNLSKNTMVAYLNGHINMTTFSMQHVKDTYPQYFPNDIFNLTDNEVYVDCGGWDGDSANEFIKQIKGKYKSIYILEPDKNMIPKLKQNIDSQYKYVLIEKGAYNKNCRVGFDNSICGTINENADSGYIEVTRLDDVINEKITFIKMDIEGSELKALEGARHLLTDSLPKMAICVYHKKEDLITIPQFIKSINPNYKLYLRAYFDYISEVVLYAIPQE